MMKLSSMQLVGSTVGAGLNGSCATAEEILECWDFDHGSLDAFRFSTNFVFTFRRQGIKQFLRFCPASERQVEHIQAETELLMMLANKGFQVAQPVASKSGNLVETVKTGLGTFHAVVFTALNGKHLQMDDLTQSQFREWGSALGRLHAACKECDVRYLNRPSWMEHLDFIREHVASGELGLLQELESITTWTESLPCNEENFGLIHFDFELDNLCWDGNEIQMLDFDDCTHHWYVADIALALRDLFDDGVDVDYEDFRLKAFLDGYRSWNPIDDALLKNFPMFLRLRKLLGYADLAKSLDLSFEETHEWLRPLHARLSKLMETYRLSLSV